MNKIKNIEIVSGNLDDLLENIELIREKIPAKSDLTQEEVIARLTGKPCGIVLAKQADYTFGYYGVV